jgi:GNAT superfamily N-acetyltransferase
VLKLVKLDYFFINKEYQNRGLGKQILTQVIEDMKAHNVTEIWAVSTINHPFWSNVYNKSFSWYESKQLHLSVTGFGYKMKI